MSAGTTAGIGAAVAAANAKKKQEQEEENMAGYNSNDLDNYEFKIVRSASGKFKKYDEVQKVCEEEAKAGWVLLEKFDNNRIRFKRRLDKRSGDQFLTLDPYRTEYGMGASQFGLLITLVTLGFVGLIIAVIFLFKSGF